MLSTLFRGVFDSDAQAATAISIGEFLLTLAI